MERLQQLFMVAVVTATILGLTLARPSLAPFYRAEEKLVDDYIVVLNVRTQLYDSHMNGLLFENTNKTSQSED